MAIFFNILDRLWRRKPGQLAVVLAGALLLAGIAQLDLAFGAGLCF
jgi:hypothetical protein